MCPSCLVATFLLHPVCGYIQAKKALVSVRKDHGK